MWDDVILKRCVEDMNVWDDNVWNVILDCWLLLHVGDVFDLLWMMATVLI